MRVWIEICFAFSSALCARFHPLMRVWIEINFSHILASLPRFHPLMRVWIEMSERVGFPPEMIVSPSYEGVD